MANEKTPVVWDDDAKKHRPLGSGEKMGGLSASSMISSDSGNLLQQGSDGLMLVTGSSLADPRADNLLEESAGGKLQVTSDRIVEWLDGHPQAAAAIADAVKVVSGDDGNVIVQGTDKGAYLPKQAISSAVSGMTDAQKNQLADAISGRIASDIADGQTVTASNGKLHFDPTSATVAQKKAINNALADTGAGLVVNGSTGRLAVDFSQMDPSTFTDFISDMIDAQTISSAGGGNHFYVDGSGGSDSSPATRGAPDKPFKTIQGCVDFITKVYKFADATSYIECKNISQTEPLKLPSFDRTSAVIHIRACDFTASTSRGGGSARTDYGLRIDCAPASSGTSGIQLTGTGVWRLSNFNVTMTDANLSSSGGHLTALRLYDYSHGYIDHCKFTFNRDTARPWQYSYTTGEHVIRLDNYAALDVNAGNMLVSSDLPVSPYAVSGGDHAGSYSREVRGFSVTGSSSVAFQNMEDNSGSGGEDGRLVMSGIFECCIYCNGSVARNTFYAGIVNYSGIVTTDYKFYISSGGHVNVSDSGQIDAEHNNADSTDTYLGGNVANGDGTTRKSYVQTSTYSWYD